MEEGSLTGLQQIALTALFEQGAAERGYFLSVGTALAEFYLHHRRSDDLDLFTRNARDLQGDFRWLDESFSRGGLAVEPPVTPQHGFLRLFVYPPEEPAERLKIELVLDETQRLEPETRHGIVLVDSFLDIAVNKVLALADRREPKDVADVFFILSRTRWTLPYLMELSMRKDTRFEHEWGLLELADRLVKVEPTGLIEKVRFLNRIDLDQVVHRLHAEGRELLRRLRPERE